MAARAIACCHLFLAGLLHAVDDWERPGGEHACDASSLLQIHADARAAQRTAPSQQAEMPDLSDIVQTVRDAVQGEGADPTGSALAFAVEQAARAMRSALEEIAGEVEEFGHYTARSREAVLGNVTAAAAAGAKADELAERFEAAAAEAADGFADYFEVVSGDFADLAPQLINAVGALGQAGKAGQLNESLAQGLARLEGFEESMDQVVDLIEGMNGQAGAQLQEAIRQLNATLEDGLVQLDGFVDATNQSVYEVNANILQALNAVMQEDAQARIAASLEDVLHEAASIFEALQRAAYQLAHGLGGGAEIVAERNGASALLRHGAILLLVPLLLRWL